MKKANPAEEEIRQYEAILKKKGIVMDAKVRRRFTAALLAARTPAPPAPRKKAK